MKHFISSSILVTYCYLGVVLLHVSLFGLLVNMFRSFVVYAAIQATVLIDLFMLAMIDFSPEDF